MSNETYSIDVKTTTIQDLIEDRDISVDEFLNFFDGEHGCTDLYEYGIERTEVIEYSLKKDMSAGVLSSSDGWKALVEHRGEFFYDNWGEVEAITSKKQAAEYLFDSNDLLKTVYELENGLEPDPNRVLASIPKLVRISVRQLYESFGEQMHSGKTIRISTDADVDLENLSADELREWVLSREDKDDVRFDLMNRSKTEVFCTDGAECIVESFDHKKVYFVNRDTDEKIKFSLTLMECEDAVFGFAEKIRFAIRNNGMSTLIENGKDAASSFAPSCMHRPGVPTL